MRISALIPAAGFSERMGQHKFALTLLNDITFLENLARQYYSYGCRHIVVVFHPQGLDFCHKLHLKIPANVDFFVNPTPEHGRFSSIKAGLGCLANEDLVYIQNVDNPIVSINTLDALKKNISEADYTFPVYQGRGGHPVLITKQPIQHILACTEDDMNLKDFLRQFRSMPTIVDDKNVLLNINTMDDYSKLILDSLDIDKPRLNNAD